MRRSSRVPPDLSPNATTRALTELARRGVPVLDLTVSNPTRVDLPYPSDLLAPLGEAGGLTYVPSPMGLSEAREAIARDIGRHGRTVDPGRIAVTASTSESYAFLFKLLCDPGDAVLVPRPSYPLFEHLSRLEGIECLHYDLEFHGTWRIDTEQVARLLSPRVKALLVVSPNNPTGSFLHRDDRDALAACLERTGTALIGDEVFADYPLAAPADAVGVLTVSNVPVFALGGLSKSVGLPQIKVGWIAAAGPAAVVQELLSAYEVIADTYLSVSTPAQRAVPSLLERGVVVRDAIRARIVRNLATVTVAVAAVPAMRLLPVEGGWSAVLQVPTVASEDAMALELLTGHGVVVHPGYFFDFPRASFLVFSLLATPAVFDEGVRRVMAYFEGVMRG